MEKERKNLNLTDNLADLLFEMPDAPPMSAKKERELNQKLKEAKEAINKDDPQTVLNYSRMREEFAIRFMFLVFKVAKSEYIKRQLHRGIDAADIAQVGSEALLKAIDNHKFLETNRFTTYAEQVIRTQVYKFLDENSRTIRVPSRVVEEIFIKNTRHNETPWSTECAEYLAEQGFEVNGGKAIIQYPDSVSHFIVLVNDAGGARQNSRKTNEPCIHIIKSIYGTDGEYHPVGVSDSIPHDTSNLGLIAAVEKFATDNSNSGLSFEEVESIKNPTVSIHGSDDEDDNGLTNIITKEINESERQAYHREIIDEVLNTLLTPRNADVVRMYFWQGMGLKQIAQSFTPAITKQRVKQILAKSIKKIQNNSEAMGLLSQLVEEN